VGRDFGLGCKEKSAVRDPERPRVLRVRLVQVTASNEDEGFARAIEDFILS
jgi:hypothetical protein